MSTARLAAKRGARLVLASRNETALRELEEEINSGGGQSIAVVADVGREEDCRRIAEAARARFGGFDTWINNAGVSVYGKMWEVPGEDHRRLFETNFWGTVYGSIAAIETLRTRGGAIINIGSAVSDRAIPYQGIYSASKHAVKGFTNALRMELEAEKLPISVTLVKPAAIDTLYIEHARNYLPKEPAFPPPVYSANAAAKTVLYACEHPVRDVFVGGAAKGFSLMEKFMPRLGDRYMEKTFLQQQQSDRPATARRLDGLFGPGRGGETSGGYEGHVMRTSLYTQASLHPIATAALLGTTSESRRELREEYRGA